MQTPPTTTGKELRKARESARLTQEAIVRYMGIKQPFYCELELDQKRANDIHLRDILAAWIDNNPEKTEPSFRLRVDGWIFEPGE